MNVFHGPNRCRRPTAVQILRLYAYTERHILIEGGREVAAFEPRRTELQEKVLELLAVGVTAYRRGG